MSLLANNCQKLTSIGRNFLRSPVISSQFSQFVPHQNVLSRYESKKWPGYHAIYNLESIKSLGIINRMKLRATIAAGVMIPALAMSEVTLGISSEFVQNASFMFGAIACFFHGIGIFANNVVGIIYVKKDSNDMKISYVSYFGNRIDIDTNFDDLSCPEEKSKFQSPLFSPLFVQSQKKKLKVFANGKIIDGPQFDKLMGGLGGT